MGERGPAPKRKSQRLGHVSKEERESATKVVSAYAVVPPDADPEWHPIGLRWFESLKTSPQSQWYTDGDWLSAYSIAESMSREFKPQPVRIGQGPDAETVMVEMPPKAASLTAWLNGFAQLLVTEGARRRVGIELQMPKPQSDGGGDVSWIDDARRHLHSAG